jgi:hypothetical protein
VNQKPLQPHIIHIPNPDLSKLGSVIMLELADEDEATRVAHRLAHETGRRITVRNARMAVIATIAAAHVHEKGRSPSPSPGGVVIAQR